MPCPKSPAIRAVSRPWWRVRKPSFVLENGFFLLNDGSGRVQKGSLRVEEGRIASIAKSHAEHKGDKRINLKGKLLIPGFVQTHVHLCQTLFRNHADDLELLDWLRLRIWPMEAGHTERSLYASARLGISELLASGTTTILDMGTVRHTDAIFTAAKELGIRAFIGKCLMDLDSNPKGLRESTKAAMKDNLALLERWDGAAGGRLRYAHAPRFLLSASEKLMRELQEISAARGNIVHTHSSENLGEVQVVREMYGCENVEAFQKLGLAGPKLVLAHCVHLNEKEEGILAATGTHVSHCPSSNLKLASGVARIPELIAKGISVSIGADGAPCNNNLDMFQEMRLASLLQKPRLGPTAMKARETFEMATINGARALGLESEVGSLEKGKKADFALLDLSTVETSIEISEKNPELVYSALVYSAGPANVRETWVDGQSVYREGSLQKAQASEIVREALAERKKLLGRI
jgi:5-methylthioadenosine/S-adenosylhomocysteine deaminase